MPGPFGSAESLATKARLELELAVSPLSTTNTCGGVSVSEVLLATPGGQRPSARATDPPTARPRAVPCPSAGRAEVRQ
ncbi:MAG TPA: hypothetical protein VH092_06085 [Urbifossiella sp.]|nr:hypothetical protein [Urbifossiella sp.]